MESLRDEQSPVARVIVYVPLVARCRVPTDLESDLLVFLERDARLFKLRLESFADLVQVDGHDVVVFGSLRTRFFALSARWL